MLFTQPQLREDTKYSQASYMGLLSNQRKPSGYMYDDVEPLKANSLQGINNDIAMESNRIASTADHYAGQMSKIVNDAGGQTRMNEQQMAEFNAYGNRMAELQRRKLSLESTISEGDAYLTEWIKEQDDSKKVKDDVSVSSAPKSDIYVPDTMQYKDINNNIAVSPINVATKLKKKKYEARLTYDEKEQSYALNPYEAGDNYDYTGSYQKHMTDLFASADNQYSNSYTNLDVDKVYSVDPKTNSINVTGNGVMLAAFLKNSQYATDARAIAAVKDKLFSMLKQDNNAMKDLGVQVAEQLYSDYANLYTKTREATSEDIADGRNVFYPKDKNGKTTPTVAANEDEEKVVMKMLNEGSENLDMNDLNVYSRLQENFVFKNAQALEGIYESDKLDVSYQKLSLADLGGSGGDNFIDLSNMRTNLNSPQYIEAISDAEGTTQTENVQSYDDDGNPINFAAPVPVINYTGTMQNIIKEDNEVGVASKLSKLESGVDQDPNTFGGIQPEEYAAILAGLPTYNDLSATDNELISINGTIINFADAGAPVYLFKRNAKDVWRPSMRIANNHLQNFNMKEGDKTRLQTASVSVVMTDTQAKKLVFGKQSVPNKPETKSFVYKPSDWEVIIDNKVAFNNPNEYLANKTKYNDDELTRQLTLSQELQSKDPNVVAAAKIKAKTQLGEFNKYANNTNVYIRNKNTGATVPVDKSINDKTSPWIEDSVYSAEVTTWHNKDLTFDGMSPQEKADFGLKKITEVDTYGRNIDLWTIEGYMPMGSVGTGDPKDAGNKFMGNRLKGALAAGDVAAQERQDEAIRKANLAKNFEIKK